MPIFLIRERSSALWEDQKNNGQFVANMYGFGMIWYGYVYIHHPLQVTVNPFLHRNIIPVTKKPKRRFR